MIEVRDLTIDFGQGPILDGLNFDVERGEICAIMGLSGGGKSTLLRCLCGLLTPDSGSVQVNGFHLPENLSEIRNQMGMVFQSSALFDSMTVAQNVAFAIQRRGQAGQKKEVKDIVNEALEKVMLDPLEHGSKLPSELSGGMKKRVGMARAIVLNPTIMLYDEPTTGLDPLLTELIDGLIAKISQDYHTTTVLVSHDVASCCRIADRIWFLESGKFSFQGSPTQFLGSDQPAIRKMLEAVKVEATR